MTKKEIIAAFLQEAWQEYGKASESDITVARAIEILKRVLRDDGRQEGV